MDVLCALAHLGFRIIQRHDAGAFLHESAVRNNEGLPVFVVHSYCDVSGQLYVLLLVIADRDYIRVIKENVRSHENRIHQETRSDRFVSSALGLELSHSGEFSCVAVAAEHPSQLSVLTDLRLHENDGLLWVDANGHVERRNVEYVLSEFHRVLRYSDRVLIDDAVDALMVLLQFNELLQSPEIVADMNVARRLYA